MTAPTSGTHIVTVDGPQIVFGQDFADQSASQVNHAPVFQTTPPTTAVVGQLLRYNALATDSDGDPLTYDLPLGPSGMGVDGASGTVVWNPTADEVGTQNALLRVSDGRGGVTLQPMQIVVSPADSPPIITTTALPTAYPDIAYSDQIYAVSPQGYHFTFSLPATGDPAGMAITAAGLLTWPVPVLGTPSVTINATDDHGAA